MIHFFYDRSLPLRLSSKIRTSQQPFHVLACPESPVLSTLVCLKMCRKHTTHGVEDRSKKWSQVSVRLVKPIAVLFQRFCCCMTGWSSFSSFKSPFSKLSKARTTHWSSWEVVLNALLAEAEVCQLDMASTKDWTVPDVMVSFHQQNASKKMVWGLGWESTLLMGGNLPVWFGNLWFLSKGITKRLDHPVLCCSTIKTSISLRWGPSASSRMFSGFRSL